MPVKNSGGPAFLLAQVGAHAAAKFAERLAPLKLTPADAGILRLLKLSPGINQQDLSAKLAIHPSRLVGVLDVLEKRSLIERRANAEDRRQYSLHITERGNTLMQDLRRVAHEHQEQLLSALAEQERELLGDLLRRIAQHQGLTPGVHPGYRWMKPAGTNRE